MLISVSNADAISFALSLILICFSQVESVKSPLVSMKVLNNDPSGNNALNSRQIRRDQTVTPRNGILEPLDRKVICYYDSRAHSRRAKGKFLPEDINAELCTHINYCFAVLDENSHLMVPGNPEIDIKRNFYSRVTSLKKKNPKLKVMLTLGGRDDSEKNPKYSDLVASTALRKLFVQETVSFLKEYDFDGLDLDWEYPGSPHYGRRGANDKENFILLVKELREAFDKAEPHLLLTALISPLEYFLWQSYKIPDLEKYLDFFNVMAYHFHGPWRERTGHHSQMYTESVLSVDYNMNYLLENGASKQKLMLGVPFFSYSFTLQDPKMNGLSASVLGDGKPGPYTEKKGILSYLEICEFIKNDNWIVVRDSGVCPYAYKGDQWVGFDDSECAREKSSYAMIQGYGGVMVFDITMDDFNGVCSKETYPLLRVVNSHLGFKEGKAYPMTTFTNGTAGRSGASVAETLSKKKNIYFFTVLCFVFRLLF